MRTRRGFVGSQTLDANDQSFHRGEVLQIMGSSLTGNKREAQDGDSAPPSSKKARDDENVESEIDNTYPCGHDVVVVMQTVEEIEIDSTMIPSFKTGPWMYGEDERLLQAVRAFQTADGNVDWPEVALFLGDRSERQCASRWTTLLQHRGMAEEVWSPEEDSLLVEAVARHERKGGGVYWAKVSEEIGRTYEHCLKRWKQVLQHVDLARTCAWTDEEDARLCEAVAAYDEQGNGSGVDWDRVSEHLGGMRSGNQCYRRWHDSLKQKRKGFSSRSEWSPQEEDLLVQGVTMYAGDGVGGGVDWDAVSSHLGGTKTSKQCNRHWNRVIKSDESVEGLIRTDLWEAEEERLLFAGIDACRNSFYQAGVSDLQEESLAMDSHGALPFDAEEDDKTKIEPLLSSPQAAQYPQVQVQVQVQPPAAGADDDDQQRYELYCKALNTLVTEVDPRTVDWVRVSVEYLESYRTPKQCERRFETYQRQIFHLSANPGATDDGFDELGARDTGTRRSIASRHRRRVSKTEPWAADEDERLTEAVALYEGKGRGGATDWGRVCEYVGGDRTYDQCRIRWNGGFKVPRGFGTTGRLGLWNPAEDEKLVEGVGIYDGQGKGGGVDWGKVSEYMHGDRTANQCHTRWNSILKHRTSERKTSAWTEVEDLKLTEAVATYGGQGRGGTVDWVKVRTHLGLERSSYQHRLRWYGLLKHRITGKRDSSPVEQWPDDEIEVLVQAVEACGSSLSMKLEVDPCQPQAHDPLDPNSAPLLASGVGSLASLAMTGALFAHLINWTAVSDYVAKDIGPERHSALQCLYAWRQAMDSRGGRDGVNPYDPAAPALHANSPWTALEDEKLTEAVGVYSGRGRGRGIDWKRVCEFMGPLRSYNQCRHRWHNVIKQRDGEGDGAGDK